MKHFGFLLVFQVFLINLYTIKEVSAILGKRQAIEKPEQGCLASTIGAFHRQASSFAK